MAAGIEIRKHPWGTVLGKNVFLYEIACRDGITVKISDFGGILQSFVTPAPSQRDIVLGYDTPEEYERSSTFFGAAVGPLADRTGGAKVKLAEREITLEKNAGNDCMHTGSSGFHRHVWNAEILPDGICLSSSFTDAPLPGTLTVSITCSVPAPDRLRLLYEAECTEETALSFTNHTYFNIGKRGENSTCLSDKLTLFASWYAETDCSENPLVTGKVLSVTGTPLDFRWSMRIGEAVSRSDFPEIASAGGLDHYFLTAGTGLRPHALLQSSDGKTELLCLSDAPGVLVYSGNGLQKEKGKNGEIYGKNGGIAFETENFPNAVNIPERRNSVILQPGAPFRTVTEFKVRCL